MAELAGKSVVIKVSGAATSMTGEVTSTEDDTVYQITEATKRVLDRDTAPTVLDGGSATEEAYTVNYLNGTITFEEADENRVITVTGKYLPMTTAAYAYDMSRREECDLADVTPFGSTNKKRLAMLKSMSGSLSHFNLEDTTFLDALQAGVPVVIEDRDAAASEPNRVWALLESSELKAAIADPQNETVTWVSRDEWIKLGG